MEESSPIDGNTALLVPAMEADSENAVYEQLGKSPPSETNLLAISYRSGPDDWIADWQDHVDRAPADFGFIHVGATARSSAAPSSGGSVGSPRPFATAVGDPTDLTGLGIQISEYLKQWAGTDRQITVYFDSVTILLQFADLNRVYRFLHVLGGRIQSVGGHAYYRFDPDAHDSQTISTIQSLMDDTLHLP